MPTRQPSTCHAEGLSRGSNKIKQHNELHES